MRSVVEVSAETWLVWGIDHIVGSFSSRDGMGEGRVTDDGQLV